MDAGVLAPAPQILFSILDGSAPLTYGSNGQFQMSPGGPSEQREFPPHGDTGDDASVSEESSALQESKAVTEQLATPSHQIQPPKPFPPSTPSPTRGRNPPLTTTTGGVNELFSNQVPTLSPHSSLPVFRISTETRGSSSLSLHPIPASKLVSLSSYSQRESVSVFDSASTAPRSSNDCDPSYLGYPCSSRTTMVSSTVTPTARLITIAPAIPAKVSSVAVKPPSWYLAVIFGTIGGVALLIFVMTIVAVTFRRAKRRRMAQGIDVPWASTPGDEEEGRLFFGSGDLSSRSVNAPIISGQQKDLADGQLRTGSGRNLGVPVGLGANESAFSLYDHPIPGSRLFSDDTLPPKSEKLNLGNPFRPTNALRLLPSHLIDEELAAQARQRDGAYSFSGRPSGLRKRSHGHLGDAIEVNPYINPPSEHLNPIANERNTTSEAAPKHRPLIDRLRNLGQDKEQPVSWDRLPTPGRDQSREDGEPWASSFKSNLLNAFTALASGLKSSGENGLDGDRLTQMPIRHRPSICRSGMEPFPRRSSTKSPAWILHEKDDGTGTVQFLPSLEKHSDFNIPTPEKLVPVLSFSRGKASPTRNDEKRDFKRTERLIYPKAPFLPATVVYPHRAKHDPSLPKRNPISRDSSVYSTSSSATSKCDLRAASRLVNIPVLNQHSSPHDDLDVVVLEPDVLSR